MRIDFICVCLLFINQCAGQELYVFSEAASIRPAKSIVIGAVAKYPDSRDNSFFRNRYIPQVTIGINKQLMINTAVAFSNYYRLDMLQFDGAKIYARYRFLSLDDIHQHFRMAVFAEGGLSSHPFIYDEMTLEGDNDGVKTGIIATQLFNKLALSVTGAYTKTFVADLARHHDLLNHSTQMVSYSLSAGYLVLPKEYTGYKQMNLNLYIELLGDKCLENDRYLVDIAPALQFIFNSSIKINMGARFQVQSNMRRVGDRTLQVGLEKTLLNAWK